MASLFWNYIIWVIIVLGLLYLFLPERGDRDDD